jgi:prepilin-type N-terminal cleavage/methylation domain-containing protein
MNEPTPAPPLREVPSRSSHAYAGHADAGQGGFTLMEIAVSLIILCVGLLALAQAMLMGYRMERSTEERKAAVRWITSQIENCRSLGYDGVDADAPSGYVVPWSDGVALGIRKDLDGDGDYDYYERYFYSDSNTADYSGAGGTVELYDDLLQGLTAQTGQAVGTVILREGDGTSGVNEGKGYWVTARVRWYSSVTGDTELKMSTLLGAK